MIDILPSIISQTLTLGALYRRMRVVKEYFEKKFYTEGGEISLAQIYAPLNLITHEQEAIAKLVRTLENVISKDNVSETIEDIINHLDSLSIRLTIPLAVTEDEEEQMAIWIREAAGREVLVDVRVDPEAIGGCMIGVGGRYYDYSYRYFFDRKKEEIDYMIRKKLGIVGVGFSDPQTMNST